MPSLYQRVRHMVGDQMGADIVAQNLEKSLEIAREQSSNAANPVSFFADPMSMFMGREWLVKKNQVSLTFDDLRKMSHNPIISSIVHTRLNQAASFMVPSKGFHQPGFIITSDDESAMKDEAKIEEITQFVMHCGLDRHGDNLLETLARKCLRDSLVLDQMCAEIVPRRNGLPAYIMGVDGATIRRLKRSLDRTKPPGSDPFYGQIMGDKIVAEYSYDQLLYGIRNPQTDVRALGYGVSELEHLFRTVTTIINAEKFNGSLLAQGGMNKGLLVVKKPPERMQFEAFKRDFRESFRNASQAWRAPVLGVPEGSDVEWLKLDQSQRDMEYAQLFDFLVKEACGVYQISPAEINWSIGASGQSQTLNAGTGDGEKMKASKNKGLKPLLTFFANQITAAIVQKIDPRYRMEFVAVTDDRKEDAEIAAMEVKNYLTVNEVRAGLSLEEIEGGDIILNQHFLKEREGLGLGGFEGADEEELSDEEVLSMMEGRDSNGEEVEVELDEKNKAPMETKDTPQGKRTN